MEEAEGAKYHESIAKLACNHYVLDLPKTGKPMSEKKEWTTLAGIVKSKDVENSTLKIYEVVAMATGTKCLGEKELNPSGEVLSDCHAEVLTRRAFLLYLHDQIDMCLCGSRKSIFEVEENSGPSENITTTFQILPGVAFHLFVSHVPCGDAAIFSNQIVETVSSVDNDEPDAKRIKLRDDGANRTGAKIHISSGPRVFEEIQEVGKGRIKPGKGDPTLCMSCSDKIAKWQILGVQGSLLGNFIKKPIRFSSIVIGSGVPFNKDAAERAIFRRFESHVAGKFEYGSTHTNPIEVSIFQSETTNFMDFEGQFHPAPASIVWALNEKTKLQPKSVQVGVAGRRQGATKKSAGTPAARLDVCRKSLFIMFVNLLKKCSKVDLRSDWTYKDAKEMNSKYKESWNWLKINVMTDWTNKPPDMMNFRPT